MNLRAPLSRLEKRISYRYRSGCLCDATGRRWIRVLVLFEGEPELRCRLCERVLDSQGNLLGPVQGTVVRVEALPESVPGKGRT
jgi:hypothetical protein